MAHALPKETQEVVDRAARLADAGRKLEDYGRVTSALMGRPRVQIDLERLEALLSEPALTISEACEQCGLHRNTFYARKQHDSALRAVYERAMAKRREHLQVTMIRKLADKKPACNPPRVSALELLASKLPDFNEAWPDEVKAKWLDAFGKIVEEAA